MSALLAAKTALIAYAASERWQTSLGHNIDHPGALPCPDRDDDGDADCTGSTTSSQIGRLPWRTLGVDDLRDASGERLWYALSFNFRKLPATVINSDTPGQLAITGTAPASNVVAVVFAPGQALQGQDRNAAHNSASSYLEGFNLSNPVNYVFATNASPLDTLNDRLVAITQADLMSAVEPALAARIERDIKPYLRTYFNQWGAFPFPAKFDDPSPGTLGAGSTRAQSAYAGDPTQTAGLLPITASASYSWAAGSGSVTKTAGPGTISGAPSCGISGTSWRCSFGASGPDCGGTSCTTSATLGIRVEGQVTNAGLSFADAQNFLVPAANVIVDQTVLVSPTPTLGLGLAATGNGRVLYGATIQYSYSCISGSCASASVSVTIPMNPADPAKLSVSKIASADFGDTAGWFNANEWYRQIYYAVSPGYLPGGGGSCTPRPMPPAAAVPPSCLRVNNLSPAYAATDDKRAILILAGRSLNGNPRPSASIGDYLEGANATALTTSPYVFEHRSGVPTSINDRVVVVSP
jgi:hypothetical protein